MFLVELKCRIKRANQCFQSREAGEQASLDVGHKNFLVLHGLEEQLFLFFRAL